MFREFVKNNLPDFYTEHKVVSDLYQLPPSLDGGFRMSTYLGFSQIVAECG
jgi:hypothetical protein